MIQQEMASLSPDELKDLQGGDEDKDQVSSLSVDELDDEMLDSVSGASIFFVPVVAVAGANVVVAVNAVANLNAGVSANAAVAANAVANANVYANANVT